MTVLSVGLINWTVQLSQTQHSKNNSPSPSLAPSEGNIPSADSIVAPSDRQFSRRVAKTA